MRLACGRIWSGACGTPAALGNNEDITVKHKQGCACLTSQDGSATKRQLATDGRSFSRPLEAGFRNAMRRREVILCIWTGMITCQGEQFKNSVERLGILSFFAPPTESLIGGALSLSPPIAHTCGRHGNHMCTNTNR